MIPTTFDSATKVWMRSLAGLDPAVAIELAADDIGPSWGNMRRTNGRKLQIELDRRGRRLERRLRRLERLAVPLPVPLVVPSQVNERRAA